MGGALLASADTSFFLTAFLRLAGGPGPVGGSTDAMSTRMGCDESVLSHAGLVIRALDKVGTRCDVVSVPSALFRPSARVVTLTFDV
jgi:hypothetical protein